jgi:CRISPR-associated protein Cas1
MGMSTLYISEEGLSLEKSGNRLVIKRKAETVKEVPLEKVENIVLMGRCYPTSPLIVELLEREIPVTWLSKTGKFFGRLESTAGINIERQREQFRRGDDSMFCLTLSKSFISAKIKNSRVLLRRYNRDLKNKRIDEIIEDLANLADSAENAIDINQLMGFEGAAGKAYFSGMSLLVSNFFRFKGRTKQPPKDPFNSLLSFGYTLLLYEVYTAIENKGLHPYAGFLHQIRRGHPALASDLIEEWRPIIVDSMVMNIAQNDIYKPDYFTTNEETGGVYLDRLTSRDFIERFEDKIKTVHHYLSYIDHSTSFRESIQFQVGSLVKAIEEKDPSLYRPVVIR